MNDERLTMQEKMLRILFTEEYWLNSNIILPQLYNYYAIYNNSIAILLLFNSDSTEKTLILSNNDRHCERSEAI
jgi:hypothetical protein